MNRADQLGRRRFLKRSAFAMGGLPFIAGEFQGDTLTETILGTKGIAAPKLMSRSLIFKSPSKDPYDLKNLYGFNHATSVVTLPDGRLLAAWFSGPFEASVHQVILASYSSDRGKTWSKAEVLQDSRGKSDFDPDLRVTISVGSKRGTPRCAGWSLARPQRHVSRRRLSQDERR